MSRFSLRPLVHAIVSCSLPVVAHAGIWDADVTVTASRVAQPSFNTLAEVTVIDRDAIERSNAASLPELLSRQAGIQYNRKGGRGQDSSLFIRGTNAAHALILVDGVRVGSSTLGTAGLENYNLDQIERIEIVRGPRSSIYGSEAIGGVIQIFTRRAGAPMRVTAGIGNDHTTSDSLTLSGATATTQHVVSLSYEATDGINANQKDESGEKDGFRNRGAQVSVTHKLSDLASVSALYLNNQGKTAFDNNFGAANTNDPQQWTDNTVASLGTNLDLGQWQLKASAGRSQDGYEARMSFPTFSRYDTVKDQGLIQAAQNNDVLGHLVFGLESLQESIASTDAFAEDSRKSTSEFAEIQKDIAQMVFSVGARHDKNSQFGSHDTGSVGAGYRPDSSSEIYTSYGTAFKAPTFNDLYFDDGFGGGGNPLLKPETSSSVELGYKKIIGMQSVDVAAYRTEVKNLIQWQEVDPVNGIWLPENVASATIKGIDAGYKLANRDWQWDNRLTLLNAQDDETGSQLPLRSRQSLSTSLDHVIDAYTVGATFNINSARKYSSGSEMIGGYDTVDLRGSWKQSKEFQLKLALTNVFEKRYQAVNGYDMPGLGALLTAVYTPQ